MGPSGSLSGAGEASCGAAFVPRDDDAGSWEVQHWDTGQLQRLNNKYHMLCIVSRPPLDAAAASALCCSYATRSISPYHMASFA